MEERNISSLFLVGSNRIVTIQDRSVVSTRYWALQTKMSISSISNIANEELFLMSLLKYARRSIYQCKLPGIMFSTIMTLNSRFEHSIVFAAFSPFSSSTFYSSEAHIILPIN